jgi:hypothetical protein
MTKEVIRSVPNVFDAYNQLIKQIGHINYINSTPASTTCWEYDKLFNIKQSNDYNYNICRGIHCDKEQCRNACRQFRMLKLENKKDKK